MSMSHKTLVHESDFSYVTKKEKSFERFITIVIAGQLHSKCSLIETENLCQSIVFRLLDLYTNKRINTMI